MPRHFSELKSGGTIPMLSPILKSGGTRPPVPHRSTPVLGLNERCRGICVAFQNRFRIHPEIVDGTNYNVSFMPWF